MHTTINMSSEIVNFDYCNQALKLKQDIEANFLVLAEYLYNIKEHNLFAPQWESFVEFCFELKMSSNMVNKLIQIHKTLILGYGMQPNEILTAGGWSVIQEVLPVISSKKDAVKWLESARTLTRQDLRKTLHETKTGIDMNTCKHKNTYMIKVCRDCGDRCQVFEKETKNEKKQ